jgi:hypothetical protein
MSRIHWRTALIQQVEFFPGLEADGFSGRDGDFGSGARVAAYSGFAGFYGKYAKTAEFNAIAVSKGVLHGLEDCVYGRFRLGTRKTCAFYYALDEVLLNQAGSPFFFPNTAVKTVSQLLLDRLWNRSRAPCAVPMYARLRW